MTSTSVDCDRVRGLAEEAAGSFDYFIERLELAGRGWSADTLPMRDLEHASRILRLTAEIDNAREAMIQPEETKS